MIFLFIHLHLYAKCKKISELLKKNKLNTYSVKRNSVKRNSVKRNSIRDGLQKNVFNIKSTLPIYKYIC